MDELEYNNQSCPGCGHPLHTEHASTCLLKGQKENGENPYSWDYDRAKEYWRKFLIPHAAEGPDVHELQGVGDIKMPVSFHTEGNYFYITGLPEGSETGAIIWGNRVDHVVKMKHIDCAKHLRGKGIGSALLADLEKQFASEHVETAYAAFAKVDVVEFFLKHGYNIVPFSELASLSEQQRISLEIDDTHFDHRVVDEESFKALAAVPGTKLRNVLLVKPIA